MGIRGFWPFLYQKGYEAPILDERFNLPDLLPGGSKLRIDIQGAIFSTIRHAYCFHDMDTAHSIAERALQRFATPANSALYLDGAPSQEKESTHRHRRENRLDALKLVELDIGDLKVRVENKLRVRKQIFLRVQKNLAKGFYWEPEARQAFAVYLRHKGWTVQECATEADPKIAQDCLPGDVVVSGDSDLLLYKSVLTVWRPFSRRRLLVYHLPDVLTAIGINRTQLTVLGVVSTNDYNANVPSLGAVSNFSIIKQLKGEGKVAAQREKKKMSIVCVLCAKYLTHFFNRA